MPYNLLSNLTLVFAILGIIILIVRRLPEAVDSQSGPSASGASHNKTSVLPPHEILQAKGLPAKTISRLAVWLKISWSKIWKFILEAKGLTRSDKINYSLKKASGEVIDDEDMASLIKNEQYFIDLIGRHPKDLFNYEQLANFYMESNRYSEAEPVYEYLTQHSPANSNYFAKLGLVKMYLDKYESAAQNYEESVKIDGSHPGRFFNLAVSLREIKNYKLGLQYAKSALALESSNQKYLDLVSDLEALAKDTIPVENIHKV